MGKLDIAKRIIEENFDDGDCGIFDTPNWIGDPMTTLYDKDGLRILICHPYLYFEVFGLTDEDYAELVEFYKRLGDYDYE